MSVPEERYYDGIREVGAGPSYILFLPSGDVSLRTTKERPEHRALRKNRTASMTVGTLTVSIADLLFPASLKCEKELALIIHSIIHKLRESASEQALKELSSMIRAARMIAHQDNERNRHKIFRSALRVTAKKLGRAPFRNEIQKVIFEPGSPNNPDPKDQKRMITEWCNDNGFAWIERGESGRPRKKIAD
jgi:hypothetical protein